MADFTTAMTGTTELDNSLVLAFDQMFMVATGQNNVMDQFVQYRKDVGAKSISMTKYARLPVATTPLTEREDPASAAMSDTEILFTPKEYGQVVTSTQLVNLQSGGKADVAAAQILGLNLGQTLDKLAILALDGIGGGNTRIVGGKAEADVLAGDVISRTELNLLYNKLARKSVGMIDGSYVLVAHDDVIADLRADTAAGSWTDVNKYASPETVLANEVGMIGGFRVIRNNQATYGDQSGAGTVDIYNSYVFGANALGRADSLPPGMVMTQTDKLNRFINLGWKAVLTYGLVDTDASWLFRSASSVGANAA